MPTVAEQLRSAREAQKLTIHQIAETTKIRTDHIRALEEGNYDVFVAPVYIRGFVRTCATLLKLDVPGVMATLDTELSGTDKFSEPPPLSMPPRGVVDFIMLQLSKVNWRKGIVVLAGVAVIAVIAGIYGMVRTARKSDPLSGLTPAVYRPASTDAGDTLPLTNPPARH